VTLPLALAGLIGLSLGLLGGGGSILTVPVLVYLLGFGAKEAIAMSLAVVGATSLVGAVGHWRSGHVNVRVALLFGGVAMVGTYLGARLAVFVSGGVQLGLFGAVMLVAAVFMLRPDDEAGAPSSSRTADTAAGALGGLSPGLVVVEGLAVGVLTGLVGVGGGFLIVPALVLLGGLPMKEAVGTSLLIIAMKSATGFYGYLGQVPVDWGFMATFTAAAVVGILAGAYLVRFVSQTQLKRAFAALLLVMGSTILWQNRAALFPAHPAEATPVSSPEASTSGSDHASAPEPNP